jgi:uncharacterized membrane protein YhaH (DUF805 family)
MAFSSDGRLSRGQFAIAVIAVYCLGLASQGLLIMPIVARAGFFPFIILHAVLLWVWFAIHAKRLRDCGHGIGSAVGIAIVNVLSIIFLLMVISFLVSPVEGQPGEIAGGVIGTWMFLIFLVEVFSGAPHLGWLGRVLMVIVGIAMLPILLAVGFSIWAGTRRSLREGAS